MGASTYRAMPIGPTPRIDPKRHERHHEHVQNLRGQQKEPNRSRVSLSSELVRHERRGEVPGDHEVTMSSATEKLTFAHSVTTRQVFVDGALRAAEWVVNRPPGRYSMQDVLFSDLE